MVGGFLFLFSKSYKNNFQNIELETSFQIIIFILYVYGSHFFLKKFWWWTKNWNSSNSSIRVVQDKKSRMVVPSKMVVQRHMGCPWGKHLDDPWHLEISIEIYLQKLVNWTTCYYFEAWVKSWFIAITSYSVLNFQRQL